MTAIDVAPPLTPEIIDGILARAGDPHMWSRFEVQLQSSGYCARPVRLSGHVDAYDPKTGTKRRIYTTDTEPDRILRKACGNRRAAVCPQCAARYCGDAFHIVSAGLRGGKGVPDTVAGHPVVFVTLTAPSFGPVHSRRLGADGKPRRCRPRRDDPVCPHGNHLGCSAIHDENDPCLGEPICPECFDYDGALLWNAKLPELWRRTTIYVPRALADITGMTQKELNRQVRVSYVKVAEYQKRGLVHLHCVLRLDRAQPKDRRERIDPPPPRFTAELLSDAIRQAARAMTFGVDGTDRIVAWGPQIDTRILNAAGDPKQAGECAAYIAKYATKSTELAGGVLHRVDRDDIDRLPVSDHVRRFLRSALDLGEQHELADLRLTRNAHNFGYRGHCFTKSRRYSTTFKALREARERHVHEQLLWRSDRAAVAQPHEERRSHFRYLGIGHITTADAYLAASTASRAREHRNIARLERSINPHNRREKQ